MLRFDACFMGPLALTYDGSGGWRYWCSAWCAAFARHIAVVKATPDGDVEVTLVGTAR